MKLIVHSRAERTPGLQLTKILLAGVVATLAMSLIAYVLDLAALPSNDYAAIYGTLVAGGLRPAYFTTAWWLGLGWHLMNGAVLFALVYGYLDELVAITPHPVTNGVIFAGVLWLISELVVKPAAGQGFFSSQLRYSTAVVLMDLFCWAVYGAVLAKLIQGKLAIGSESEERRAA